MDENLTFIYIYICSNELLRVNFYAIIICVLWKNESKQESSFGKILYKYSNKIVFHTLFLSIEKTYAPIGANSVGMLLY